MMSKIGIVAWVNEESGGLFQYTLSMIDAILDDNSNNYTLITSSDSIEKRYKHRVETFFYRKKRTTFQKIICALFVYLRIRKPVYFTKQERLLYKDIDIFLSPTISYYPGFQLNKPYIFTCHDLQDRWYPKFFSIKSRIQRRITFKIALKYASYILCESQYVKKDINRFYNIPLTKISVIKAPPPKEFINKNISISDLNRVREKYNLPKNYIFYPAKFWFHKNHLKLIDAFRIVSEKHNDVFLILSGGKAENYDNVFKRIEGNNLSNRVIYIGYIDYSDLPAIYKLSKILIMPSLYESISIPIYEAFAMKIPVASSNKFALAEQVKGAGILFNPENPSEIAGAIIKLLEDKLLANHLAEEGFKKLLEINHETYKVGLQRIINTKLN